MDELFVIGWKDHRKSPHIIDDQADKMTGVVNSGFNNFANQA
jgi:hypothetical protein